VDYKERIRSLDHPQDQDSGNSTITCREERCSNQTHVSTTNPDAKLANKQNGTGGTHTVGAANGYVAKPFLTALFLRRIRPHIAAKITG
jgi:hypothetical protein